MLKWKLDILSPKARGLKLLFVIWVGYEKYWQSSRWNWWDYLSSVNIFVPKTHRRSPGLVKLLAHKGSWHVAASCCSRKIMCCSHMRDMFVWYVRNVTLSLLLVSQLHVPSTSLLHVIYVWKYMILSLQHVAGKCPCVVNPRVREGLWIELVGVSCPGTQ